MTSAPRACLSCGARLAPDDTHCPLCGTPAGRADLTAPEAPEGEAPDVGATAAPPESASACPVCGHANPNGARFCNACGAPLPAHSAPTLPLLADPAPARPPSDAGRQALMLVAVAVAIVAALYGVTLWSESRDQPSAAPAVATAPGVGPAAAIPDGPPPALPDTMQSAADAQAALGTPAGHYEAGRYYLTAAFEAREADPVASAQWARAAREAFEASLAGREDPDVRLALAEALRFDPAAPPMQPIEEVQRVLAMAPDHAGANYLMGDLRLMRAQFQPQWADSARASFQRVVESAPPGSELHARASRALADLGS